MRMDRSFRAASKEAARVAGEKKWAGGRGEEGSAERVARSPPRAKGSGQSVT